MASLIRLQECVAAMMQGGASLELVEAEVIEPAELKSEQKAALWLYAWSFVEGRQQRAQAARYLAATRD